MLKVDELELVDVVSPPETNERARSPAETFMAIKSHGYEKNADEPVFCQEVMSKS